MDTTFEQAIDAFWEQAETRDPQRLADEVTTLCHQWDVPAARLAFEQASVHDFLGHEALAVEGYRRALATGLEAPHHHNARIQLASTLRNLGQADQAIDLLRSMEDTPQELLPGAQAFLALALYDDGQPAEALRTALLTLAPNLPTYRRSIIDYAHELDS